MLSQRDHPPPRKVHPLRSRIVFFLRDWSLTLYVAPFALAKPSYWFLLILPLGAIADWELRRAADGLAGRDPSRTRWEPLAYFRTNLRLMLVLLLISAGLVGVFGPKAASETMAEVPAELSEAITGADAVYSGILSYAGALGRAGNVGHLPPGQSKTHPSLDSHSPCFHARPCTGHL